MFFFDDQPVDNKHNSTNIKAVSIIGLFGTCDIKLEFEKEANIYIGENGLGKTTILNCIYYVLHGEYEKLVGIPFATIIFKYKNGRDFFY